MTTAEATATAKSTFSPPANIQRSSWHSPVPYLFGGLAAMLGLVAFALLLLACSYWRLTSGEDSGDRDVESGAADKGEGDSAAKAVPIFEEKFLVIMAGDEKPTFLAAPMSRTNNVDEEKVDIDEKVEEENIKQKDETTEENVEDEQPMSQEQMQ